VAVLILTACTAERPPPLIFSCDTARNVERCERRRTRILYPNPDQRPAPTLED
jgi:hypothetical protein